MGARPAIFLDRDGTLNELVGFVNHREAFRLFPWAAESVRLINRSGYLAVLVTNQSGVARGLFPEDLVGKIHARLAEMLDEAGAHLDGLYYCPHGHSGTCRCRKPQPGMLLRAEKELDVDLSRSFVVGDSYADMELAWNAGARAALVLTGYGRGAYEHHRDTWARLPEVVAPNLFAAVTEILWEASP
jgi:D-glycero-D-manno-heptose 1,7-bisphosphate phosphatase